MLVISEHDIDNACVAWQCGFKCTIIIYKYIYIYIDIDIYIYSVMPCHVMPCQIMSCHIMSSTCHVITLDTLRHMHVTVCA